MTREDGAPKGFGRTMKGCTQLPSPLDKKEKFLALEETIVGFLKFGVDFYCVFSPAIYPNPGFNHSLSLQMFNALSQY
jgi:hypothetical protein